MKKVGLITYHSAYNFGSTLQALATQKAIEKLGYECEIINYRMNEQKKYYSLYRTSYGIKILIKDLLRLPMHSKRVARANGYESFIRNYMNLSKEVNDPEEVFELYDQYDQIVSGSDQIWNKHSNELNHAEWKFMYPYLLKGYTGRKISYASSIGDMNDDNEIKRVCNIVKNFDYISMRESVSAQKFSNILKRNIPVVLDPTLLFDKSEWVKMLNLKKIEHEPYIFYYSLANGIKDYYKKVDSLRRLSHKKHMKVLLVTPIVEAPILDSNIEQHTEYSTLDFLNAIYNADIIVTDSYHGSLFSVNFNKNIFSICGEYASDFRKTDILKRIGMENRIVDSIDRIIENDFEQINYNSVNSKINSSRMMSYEYLRRALNKQNIE